MIQEVDGKAITKGKGSERESRNRFCGTHVVTVHGGDEDRATRVLSLADKEPVMVVKACVDIMWEVVQEDCGYGRDSVVGKGEAALRGGGSGSIHERAFGTEYGDIGCDWGSGGHRGLEVLTSRGGDEHVVRIDGDVFVKWGKEKSVEDFLGYAGRCGRHGR